MSAEQILSRLMQDKPLSLLRIGDGESIALNGFNEYSKYHNVLKRQLGFSPPIEHAEQIRENLIQAYKGADIIGIPQHKNIESLNSGWRQAQEMLDKYAPDHTKEYCSIDIGYDFLNAGYFNDLLQDRKELNYISCRNLDLQFSSTWNISVVNSYIISPEAKFTSGYAGAKHYPDQFNKAARWMDVRNVKGQLLLVGAGVIGKIYCNWWRDLGGISFDIGSVFDEWAGKATRGPERGLDVEVNSKFKLL